MAEVQRRWLRLPERARLALLILAVVICTGARLSNHAGGDPLSGPDWPELLPHLETADGREILSWFTGDWVQHNGYYRPLSSLSFLLDYVAVGEDHPLYWRLHNLVLMAGVAALLAALTRALTGSDAAGLVAGVVSMGARTEGAVMFRVSPRTDVLCALFLPASLLWMLSWARGSGPGALAAALVAAGLSVLSKEAGLLLGALVPLTLWAKGASRRRITVAAGACLAVLLVYWLARSHFLQVPAWSLSMPVRQFPLHSRGLVVLRTVLPVAWSVHAWAGFVPIQLLLATTWLRALGDLAELAQWPLVAVHRVRLLLLGVLWQVAAVVPVTNYALLSPQYLYLPGLGDCFLWGCAVAGAAAIAGRRLSHLRPAQEQRQTPVSPQ